MSAHITTICELKFECDLEMTTYCHFSPNNERSPFIQVWGMGMTIQSSTKMKVTKSFVNFHISCLFLCLLIVVLLSSSC